MTVQTLQFRPNTKISQGQLATFVALQNAQNEAQKVIKKEGQRLLEAIMEGAIIEDGTHIAEIITIFKGKTMMKTLRVR